jgi:hypothetical protein
MISFADGLVFLGLALLGVGLWWWRPWVALTVVGAVLLALGLLGSLRGK